MELYISDEIDLAFFVDLHQTPETFLQEFFKRGVFDAGVENRVAFLGVFLVRALVVNEGILDIPFAQFQPTNWNAKICIDLAIKTFEDRAMRSENTANRGGIRTPRLDLDRHTHESP
jgi:hypothetical protein